MRRARWLWVALLLAPRAGHSAEVTVGGTLDLNLTNRTQVLAQNLLFHGDSYFDPYHLRLEVMGSISPNVEVKVQSYYYEGGGVIADGAYAIVTPWLEQDAHLLLGKMPFPIGTFGPRTYSEKNPLVGIPLMYQHRTSLNYFGVPPTVDALVAAAGNGNAGVNYGTGFWSRGMPVIDNDWWDFGAAITGSRRPFEYSIGFINGSPGLPQPGRDGSPGTSVLGRAGLAPIAGLTVGVSGSWGTYLLDDSKSALPAGDRVTDYLEKLAMADFEWMRGPFELRGEGCTKEWETAYTGRLDLRDAYGEAKVAIGPGAWLAGRAEGMRFSPVTTTLGARRPWDDNVDRFQAGAGFRATRDVRVKAVWQRDVRRAWNQPWVSNDLFDLAFSFHF